jgi:hypothetical protein
VAPGPRAFILVAFFKITSIPITISSYPCIFLEFHGLRSLSHSRHTMHMFAACLMKDWQLYCKVILFYIKLENGYEKCCASDPLTGVQDLGVHTRITRPAEDILCGIGGIWPFCNEWSIFQFIAKHSRIIAMHSAFVI